MARRFWTQLEVVEMGKFLGLKNWDRRLLRYYTSQGIFPKPKAGVDGMMQLYSDTDLELGFVDVGKRVRSYTKITPEDVQMARTHVLESNKSKNISKLINYIAKNGNTTGTTEGV